MRSLYRNGVGDEGGKALASALEVNAVLTSLDLSSDFYASINIGDQGAIAIAEALKVNKVLTSLK